MATRKIPIRRCLGCNEGKPKRELIRIVKNSENQFFVDKTGKMNGRGAYVCPNAECFAKARKAKRLERTFECSIPPEIYEELEKEIDDGG